MTSDNVVFLESSDYHRHLADGTRRTFSREPETEAVNVQVHARARDVWEAENGSFGAVSGGDMITLSDSELSNLDSLYDARDASDRPSEWGTLVAKLRAIRRSIESGEAVKVHDGAELHSVLEFHIWAYRHFKLLEEGYDSWIGDDK